MRVAIIVALAALLVSAAVPANASLLGDWFGVSLSVGGTGSFNNSWAPISSTADYFVDDNWSSYFGRTPHGGELFDIEAIYFDNDATHAYIAVVTSFAVPNGVPYLGSTVHAGDLALDLGGGAHDAGIDVDGNTGRIANTSPGDWYQSNSLFAAESGPTNFSGGVDLGYATLNCYNYGLVERGKPTYVFEMTFDRNVVGGAAGDPIGLEWTMGCRNDVIRLAGDFDGGETPPVPEPGTLILLGSGLLGMAGIVRRRRS
jgi:hypothetical protein